MNRGCKCKKHSAFGSWNGSLTTNHIPCRTRRMLKNKKYCATRVSLPYFRTNTASEKSGTGIGFLYFNTTFLNQHGWIKKIIVTSFNEKHVPTYFTMNRNVFPSKVYFHKLSRICKLKYHDVFIACTREFPLPFLSLRRYWRLELFLFQSRFHPNATPIFNRRHND